MIKIDYEAIKINLKLIEKNNYLVLKNNAYGFGLVKVLEIAYELGFYKFCVLDLDDAIMIKRLYESSKVLLLGMIDRSKLYVYEKYRIEVSLNDITELKYLYLHNIMVQICLNTGMNRFGIRPNELEKVVSLIKKTNIKITGVYSHNASNVDEYINKQIALFKNAILNLGSIDTHYASTSLLGRKIPFFKSKRIGDFLYFNALNVYGKIIKINYVYKNEYIGYDSAYKMKNDGYIGVIDLGYADGLVTKCGGFLVYIDNKYYRLIGKACMNHTFVLIDDKVKVGDTVHFISPYNNIINYENFFGLTSHEVYLAFLKKY